MTARMSAIKTAVRWSFCAVAAFVPACQKCSPDDDVALIRQLVVTAAELAEAKQVGNIMGLTTDDLVANPGQRNRSAVKRILFAAFHHYGTFDIKHPRPLVDIIQPGASAKASVPFLIVQKDKAFPELSELYDDPTRWMEAVGEMADPYELELELVKSDGEWRVRKATLLGLRSIGTF